MSGFRLDPARMPAHADAGEAEAGPAAPYQLRDRSPFERPVADSPLPAPAISESRFSRDATAKLTAGADAAEPKAATLDHRGDPSSREGTVSEIPESIRPPAVGQSGLGFDSAVAVEA